MYKPFKEKRKDWAQSWDIKERDVAASLFRGYSFLGPGVPVKHALRSVYQGMIMRCYNPNVKAYKDYGAKGIRVCGRWFYSFAAFASDMGERPAGHTLDRLDNTRGYSPDNCRWADWSLQAANRVSTICSDHRAAIRKDRQESGLSFEKLGKKYGVSRGAAHYICKE